MKNHNDKTINIQTSSKPTPRNRTGTNEDTYQRNLLFNDDKAQCSDIKGDKLFDDNNIEKYLSNSGELTPFHIKLNRNMGEHFLFKDVEYSQSRKSICFTRSSGMNCINEEENIAISTGNHKQYNTQKLNNTNTAQLLTSNVKLYEDKATYCRPVLNYYNQQFIYKTKERNAKLKNLVKKLSLARQREKEKVNWNNFKNELKNKHRYGHDDALLEEYVTPEIINDDSDTTISWEKSRLCRNILQDFYGAYDTLRSNGIHGRHQQPPEHTKYLPYNTNFYCYPTSSTGRLMMLRRDQENYKYLCKREEKTCHSEENTVASDYKSCMDNPLSYKNMDLKNFKSSLVQVDNVVIPSFIEKDKATNNSNRSNERNKGDELNYIDLENTNNSSLVNIENKLEYLIEAINSFIVQIKSHKRSDLDKNSKTVPCKIGEKLNMIKRDSWGMREKENKVLGEVTANSSESTLTTGCNSPSDAHISKINEILREVGTYNNVDFQNQLRNGLNKSCSLQISIEVPTKDCCTEVTKSLSKHVSGDDKMVTIEEIITPKRTSTQEKILPLQHITIAVNTDPLSFLALLRFSTETLKRLMSYMPNFDYLSYLSTLNFLQASRTAKTNYICKICGAAFDNPTRLSDHIRGHDLGKTRDCCVCRHVLERAPTSLFSCQYCGEHFTRAYCCEFHQQSCAKRLGICHNVASSLMLLR